MDTFEYFFVFKVKSKHVHKTTLDIYKKNNMDTLKISKK